MLIPNPPKPAHLTPLVSNVLISIESCVLKGLVFYRSYKNRIKLRLDGIIPRLPS